MGPELTIGLIRAAGYSAYAAIATLVVAAVTIGLFFGGAGQFWGPVNDVFVSLTTLLLILPVLAILLLAGDHAGWWFSALSWLAIAGLLLVAVGQLLLVVGVISLNASFLTGGIGISPFLLWALATIWTAWTFGVPSMMVGFLLAGVLVVSALTTAVSLALPGVATGIVSAVLTLAVCAWMAALGSDLLGRA
ncbi:MAG: hypothetical protein WED12_06505 [Chloroflexota bacterium]